MFFVQSLVFAGKTVFGEWRKKYDSIMSSNYYTRLVYVDGVVFAQSIIDDLGGSAFTSRKISVQISHVDAPPEPHKILGGYNVLPHECFDGYRGMELKGASAFDAELFKDKSVEEYLTKFINKVKAVEKYQKYFEEDFVPGDAEVELGDGAVKSDQARESTDKRVIAKKRMASIEEKIGKRELLSPEDKKALKEYKGLFSEKSPSFKRVNEDLPEKIRVAYKDPDFGLTPEEKRLRDKEKKLEDLRKNLEEREELFESEVGKFDENMEEQKKRLADEHSKNLEEERAKIKKELEKKDAAMTEEKKRLEKEKESELASEKAKIAEEKRRLAEEHSKNLEEERAKVKEELEKNKIAMEAEKKRLDEEKSRLEAEHSAKIAEYENHKREAEEALKKEQEKALQEKDEAQKKIDAMKAAGATPEEIAAATAEMEKKFKDAEEKMRKEKEESDKALSDQKLEAEKLKKDLEAAAAANKEALEKMAKDHDALSKNLEEQKNEIEKSKAEAERLKKEAEEAKNSNAKNEEKLAEMLKKEQEKADLLNKFKDELAKTAGIAPDELKIYKPCGLDELLKAIKESSLSEKAKEELRKNLFQAFELPLPQDSPAGSGSPKPDGWSGLAKLGIVVSGLGVGYLILRSVRKIYSKETVDAKNLSSNQKKDKKIVEVEE